MDFNQRGDVIANHEHDTLNKHLDQRDFERCGGDMCDEFPSREYRGVKYCPYCYRDLIEEVFDV